MAKKELLEIIERAAKEDATVLDLSRKGLTSLPAKIGLLTNLKVLRLNGNQLNELPAEIGQLTNLKMLDLEGNPLESPPMEVVRQGTAAGIGVSAGVVVDEVGVG